MNQARIEGFTQELGRRQGYKPLYVRQTPVTDTVVNNTTMLLETAWEPTVEEIAMLLKGAKIHVGILSVGHPPIKVTVGPVPDERVET
jgi:hypothetical protein